MKISIAMATYNGAKYLPAQLDSFLAQTRLPDELIITDDGSTDDTLDIIKRFAETAPFPVIYSQNEQNLGFAGNFNVALQKTTGDVVFLSDQDDVWFQEKLSVITNVFERNRDVMVVINDAKIVDGALNDTGLTKLGQVRSLGLPDTSFVTGCCSALRSRFLSALQPLPDHGLFVHDTWLHALANRLEVRILLETPMQQYRRHASNASACISSKLTPLSPIDLVRAYRKVDSRPVCHHRLQQLLLMHDRIEKLLPDIVSLMRRNCAIESVEHEIIATNARLQLLDSPRLLRIYPALKMYARGQYTGFSGWKSMVKDLLYV